MKILIVASFTNKKFSPFVTQQVETMETLGFEFEYFGITGKGVLGYLTNRTKLIRKIKAFKPDIIHAHYGLSGLLANLQRRIPVVTTFHGSDIHSSKRILFLSRIAMFLSSYNIFVAQSLYNIAKYNGRNFIIQSCGVDISLLKPVPSKIARAYFGWDQTKIYILFSGSFDNQVKNYLLAKQSVELVEDCKLVELKGYTKEQVGLLMNACNLLLVTSFRESGPLVVKEAMACNRPIVTTDVGDVRWVIGDTDGCYITSYDPAECGEHIRKAIDFSLKNKETNGRERISQLGLDTRDVMTKIVGVYTKIYRNNRIGSTTNALDMLRVSKDFSI